MSTFIKISQVGTEKMFEIFFTMNDNADDRCQPMAIAYTALYARWENKGGDTD